MDNPISFNNRIPLNGRAPWPFKWIALCGVGAFLSYQSISHNQISNNHSALANSGKPIGGTVVQRDGMPADRGTNHVVKYSYDVNGTEFTGRSQLPMDDNTFGGLPIGGTIPVLYLPSDPSVSCYSPEILRDMPPETMLLGWGVIACGVTGFLVESIYRAATARGRRKGPPLGTA